MPDARDSGTIREDDPERTKRDQARREFNEGWAEAVASANHGLTGDAGEVERLSRQLAGAVEEIERLRVLVCTCRAYELNFSEPGPPPHRDGCPALPPAGGQ